MLLSVVIAVELVASLAALAVIGTEPTDRRQIFSRAVQPAEPGGSLFAPAPPALPAYLSAARARITRRALPLRLLRAGAPMPAHRKAIARTGPGASSWRPPRPGQARAAPAQPASEIT
jgi:hypothetical protein